MARQSQSHGAIAEIESGGERLAEWIRGHPVLVIGGLVAVLATAGGIGVYASYSDREALEASNALDRVHSSYMKAMGASPSDLVVPELANPSAA